MQILPINYNNKSYSSTNKKCSNVNFGSMKLYSTEDVVKLSTQIEQEVSDGLRKLVGKIKFVDKILGKNDKTIKPVGTKIGDSFVYINMDKSVKGKTKINIFSDTKGIVFKLNPMTHQYTRIEDPEYIRQFLDIIISDKDGRMSNGTIQTIDGSWKTFERNTHTGKRSAEGESFRLIPNLSECNNEQRNLFDMGYDRDTLTIKNIFLNLFSKLSLVKPDISLK